ncbi:TlpA disulfide reductase family protein [Streptosporangium sp. NPDC002544]|uniref:TlpA family protein disulfide reductase n=1 Tax=Streptosporangium sp. NPDC002544 TaxID=3154538 RepID=UPI0033340BFE
MAYLAAVAVLVGLLVVTNLIFTVGVVRRLREHTAELAALRDGGSGGVDVAMPAGSSVDGFDATSVADLPVSLATLGERPLVGFFSPSCQPCKERLPSFVEYAATRPGGRDAVLAVTVGTREETAALVELLRPVATVVVEADRGPVQQAFGVTGFPAFVLVEEGVVAASGYELAPVVDRDAVALPAAG